MTNLECGMCCFASLSVWFVGSSICVHGWAPAPLSSSAGSMCGTDGPEMFNLETVAMSVLRPIIFIFFSVDGMWIHHLAQGKVLPGGVGNGFPEVSANVSARGVSKPSKNSSLIVSVALKCCH